MKIRSNSELDPVAAARYRSQVAAVSEAVATFADYQRATAALRGDAPAEGADPVKLAEVSLFLAFT